MRDLELRGAGNILGPEQHGHIAAVGFDLYCKMLEEEMNRARGLEVDDSELSTLLEFDINAYIPDDYISDSVLKVEIYKRIVAVQSEEEIEGLSVELCDRYGQLPPTVDNLLFLGKIKLLAQKLRIHSIKQKEMFVELRFAEKHPVKGDDLLTLMQTWKKRLQFSEKNGFMIKVSSKGFHTGMGVADLIYRMLQELYGIVSVKS